MHWNQDTKEIFRLYHLPKVLLRSSSRFHFREYIVNDDGAVRHCRFKWDSRTHVPTAVLVIDEPHAFLRRRLSEKAEDLQGELAVVRTFLSRI